MTWYLEVSTKIPKSLSWELFIILFLTFLEVFGSIGTLNFEEFLSKCQFWQPVPMACQRRWVVCSFCETRDKLNTSKRGPLFPTPRVYSAATLDALYTSVPPMLLVFHPIHVHRHLWTGEIESQISSSFAKECCPESEGYLPRGLRCLRKAGKSCIHLSLGPS